MKTITRISLPTFIRDEFFNDALAFLDKSFADINNVKFPSPVFPTDKGYPRASIFETNDKYILETTVPGLKRENLKITVENGILIIRGEARPKTNSACIYNEILRREFTRGFNLPDDVQIKKINTKIEDGILTINLPKREPTPKEYTEIKIN